MPRGIPKKVVPKKNGADIVIARLSRKKGKLIESALCLENTVIDVGSDLYKILKKAVNKRQPIQIATESAFPTA